MMDAMPGKGEHDDAERPARRRVPRRAWGIRGVCALAAAAAFGACGVARADEPLASPWQAAHAARARLVAAGGPLPAQSLLAAIEIELSDGWKTYWRMPGDAGGVPPSFDWNGTTNATAQVSFPAPKRFTDRSGDTVGYKGSLVLPVRLAVADASRPVQLRLKLDYGICREICVPAEASFTLDVPAGYAAASRPEALDAALARVPGPASATSPALVSHKIVRTGDKPQIVFEARYPGAAAHADAFVEASGDVPLALPRKTGAPRDGLQSYIIELTADDAKELAGKTLTVTLVSDEGQSETRLPVP